MDSDFSKNLHYFNKCFKRLFSSQLYHEDLNFMLFSLIDSYPEILTYKEIDNEFAYIFNKFYDSPIKNYIFASIPDNIYVYKNKNICNLFSAESNIEQKKLWEQRQKEYNTLMEKNALLNVLDSMETNINKPIKRL